MKVSVIGAGNMGSGFVKQLAGAGYTVQVTARDQVKAEGGADFGFRGLEAFGFEHIGGDATFVIIP
ncbi:MAG: NADPH-dependent F420 reductase, partial [Gammaproteobacteria bacterium]|nr:NADPH-dependent F420 reductase [Gammaproteobacteria bacterium]